MMMRTILAAMLCAMSAPVLAKPSQHGPAYAFDGDRYVRTSQLVRDVTGAVRCPPPACQRGRAGKAKHLYRMKPRQKGVPVPTSRPVAPLTMAGGFTREVGTAVGTVRSRFIRGRLVCARNVNAALAARGIKGTNSALAKSFLRWGHSTHPVPGAVAVFLRRGGYHTAIVHSVKPNGEVIYLNPSSRMQAWVIGPYRRQPIAFRVAS